MQLITTGDHNPGILLIKIEQATGKRYEFLIPVLQIFICATNDEPSAKFNYASSQLTIRLENSGGAQIQEFSVSEIRTLLWCREMIRRVN